MPPRARPCLRNQQRWHARPSWLHGRIFGYRFPCFSSWQQLATIRCLRRFRSFRIAMRSRPRHHCERKRALAARQAKKSGQPCGWPEGLYRFWIRLENQLQAKYQAATTDTADNHVAEVATIVVEEV